MSMPTPSSGLTGFTIVDLARLADVTPRTVRYYVAQGLLPSPGQAGPGARYPDSALSRLRLIRELQRNHLPLAEIRTRLAGLPDAEVAALLAPPSMEPPDTALDYIRGVLGASRGHRPRPALPFSATAMPAPAMSVAPSGGAAAREPGSTPVQLAPAAPTNEAASPAAARTAEAPATSAGEPATPERSQWDRIALTTDIELQIRRPLGRLDQRRVERLIAIARQVLKEDTP